MAGCNWYHKYLFTTTDSSKETQFTSNLGATSHLKIKKGAVAATCIAVGQLSSVLLPQRASRGEGPAKILFCIENPFSFLPTATGGCYYTFYNMI